MEIKITLKDFKLIKSFYPDFIRKPSIQSNDFIIGWSELMPLVSKIAELGMSNTVPDRVVEMVLGFSDTSIICPINGVYERVLVFIKWYNENVKHG